jgi:hypothetical protein
MVFDDDYLSPEAIGVVSNPGAESVHDAGVYEMG